MMSSAYAVKHPKCEFYTGRSVAGKGNEILWGNKTEFRLQGGLLRQMKTN